MFILKFLSNLPQPPKDNPWPTNSTNKNFITQFHCHCNYLVGFQASRKINDSILEKIWLKNNTDAKDDPYQTLALSNNKEMDQLMVANTINNEVNVEDILGLNDKEENEVQ